MSDNNLFSITILKTEAAKLAVNLSDDQAIQLATYMQMLIEYNQHTNLVGNATPECLLHEHILDSLTLIPIIQRLQTPKKGASFSLIDIGSGAGFPGLVLAIAKVELKLTALDATNKKIVFLQSVAQKLDLSKRVKIINARAEELAYSKAYRASFDYVTCRAMGALPIVCELTMPFLKTAGYALLQRGSKQINAEKQSAQKEVTKLGARLIETILLDRNILEKDHYVMTFKQDKVTPAKFPRPWKIIKDKPIF